MSLAKVLRPRVDGVVSHRALQEWLAGGSSIRTASWLAGPAGSGKTSQVAAFVARHHPRALWYQLDAGDGDLETFVHHLFESARAVGWSSAPPPDRPLSSAPRARIGYAREALERLLSSGQREPLVLVLDDYHELDSDAELHEILPVLVGLLSGSGRLIVASRASPPRSVTRLRVHGRLEVAEPSLLGLAADEARELVRRRHPRLPADVVERVVRDAGGFPAALVVLSDAAVRRPGAAQELGLDLLFDYFAAEVLEGAGPEVRQVLFAAACLSAGTAAMVARCSGCSGAGAVLDRLARQGAFLSRHEGPDPIFRLHRLFRDVVRMRARKELGVEGYERLQARAAEELARAGEVGAAAALWAELANYDALAELVSTHAIPLYLGGRHGEVERWLAPVPEEELRKRPWMLYWLGASRLPRKGGAGRQALLGAYEAFLGRGDPVGAYATFTAVANSYLSEMGRFDELRAWLDRIDDLRAAHPDYPDRGVEVDVTATVIGGMLLSGPDPRRLAPWVERGRELLRDTQETGRRLVLAYALYEHAMHFGNYQEARRLGAIPLREVDAGSLPPAARAFREHFALMVRWEQGEPELALEHLKSGLRAATEARAPTCHLLTNGIQAALTLGDLEAAEALLAELEEQLDPRGLIHLEQHAAHRAVLAVRRGELDRAERSVREALTCAEEASSPIYAAYDRLGLGIVLGLRGRFDEGRREILRAEQFAKRAGSRWLLASCGLYRGWLELRAGLSKAAAEALRQGLALVRDEGYPTLLTWVVPEALSEVLGFALREGIEAEAARHLIASVRIPPPLEAGPEWPYPMRIHALGRLRVEREGSVADLGGGRRLRELLGLLVAAPGQRLPQTAIEDFLWPEASGDAARRAFDTALHRLRRKLGDPGALQLRAGELAVDPSRCLVDVVVLEARTRELLEESDLSLERQLRLAAEMQSLYRGPLLPGLDLPPILVARRRVRRQVGRAAAVLGRSLRQVGREAQAEQLEEWLRAVDPEIGVGA